MKIHNLLGNIIGELTIMALLIIIIVYKFFIPVKRRQVEAKQEVLCVLFFSSLEKVKNGSIPVLNASSDS